jgi:hypothetical protein
VKGSHTGGQIKDQFPDLRNGFMKPEKQESRASVAACGWLVSLLNGCSSPNLLVCVAANGLFISMFTGAFL